MKTMPKPTDDFNMINTSRSDLHLHLKSIYCSVQKSLCTDRWQCPALFHRLFALNFGEINLKAEFVQKYKKKTINLMQMNWF